MTADGISNDLWHLARDVVLRGRSARQLYGQREARKLDFTSRNCAHAAAEHAVHHKAQAQNCYTHVRDEDGHCFR